MKKDDLLTHLSFFGVLMTMAVLPAPADAGSLSLDFTRSDSIPGHMSAHVFTNDSRVVLYELGSAYKVSYKEGYGRYRLVVNDFKSKNLMCS